MSTNHPAFAANAPSPNSSTIPTRPTHPDPEPPRRTRPRLTEQIQVIRELWVLREQARVQAAERCFLTELERLISGPTYYSTSSPSPPRPPVPENADAIISATTSTTSSIPNAPPLPPLPPSSIAAQTSTAVTLVEDGFVFESNPPPRGDRAPAREQPWTASLQMEEARASQRVTNLSAEFRARLERQEDDPDQPATDDSTSTATMPRSRSQSQLSHQRAVSSVLDSQFRHHLERVIHQRRGNRNLMSHLYRTAASIDDADSVPPTLVPGSLNDGDALNGIDMDEQMGDGMINQGRNGGGDRSGSLQRIVNALREEVNVLRNVVNASFDLQLDIQRSIRQEVAAAMSKPAMLSITNAENSSSSSACTTVDEQSSSMSTEPQQAQRNVTTMTGVSRPLASAAHTGPMKAGICVVCLEQDVDCLLYACGHMCTCSSCGRQLLASGISCPICRAPVRDVVRAFAVTER